VLLHASWIGRWLRRLSGFDQAHFGRWLQRATLGERLNDLPLRRL
jgi:hypothetical protein